jgi:hypothetical protein
MHTEKQALSQIQAQPKTQAQVQQTDRLNNRRTRQCYSRTVWVWVGVVCVLQFSCVIWLFTNLGLGGVSGNVLFMGDGVIASSLDDMAGMANKTITATTATTAVATTFLTITTTPTPTSTSTSQKHQVEEVTKNSNNKKTIKKHYYMFGKRMDPWNPVNPPCLPYTPEICDRWYGLYFNYCRDCTDVN